MNIMTQTSSQGFNSQSDCMQNNFFKTQTQVIGIENQIPKTQIVSQQSVKYPQSQSIDNFSTKLKQAEKQALECLDELIITNENQNPQLVKEYQNEIYVYLRSVELLYLPRYPYMKNFQTDINDKMRSILIDWLVDVHLKFKLLPETLFLTVNLIDRYLSRNIILRTKLQLIGVTAMLIACKYEEIYAPEVRDFVYITDQAYTKEEILKMENEMLRSLEFNITTPSAFRFLEIYSNFLNLDEHSFMFCRYLIELFLVDHRTNKFNPSLLSAGAIYITLKITKKNEFDLVTKLSEYNDEKLRECAKDICLLLDNEDKSSLKAVKKKFSHAKFLEVAKIKFF